MAGLCRSVPGAVASWGGSSDGRSGRLFATGARRKVSSASSGMVFFTYDTSAATYVRSGRLKEILFGTLPSGLGLLAALTGHA